MTISEEDLWDGDRCPDMVSDGQVVDGAGKALRLRAIIARRWGWPKAAADRAAEMLRSQADTRPARLWLNNPGRGAQQAALLLNNPEILGLLLSGLARGGSRERYDLSAPISTLVLRVVPEIDDAGLVGSILDALAARIGLPIDQLRQRLSFQTEGDTFAIEASLDGLAVAAEDDRHG